MQRNDKTHISALDKTLYNEKWVAFVSKDWADTDTPISLIIASSHCLEMCNKQQVVLDAWARGEAVINEFISSKALVTEYP